MARMGCLPYSLPDFRRHIMDPGFGYSKVRTRMVKTLLYLFFSAFSKPNLIAPSLPFLFLTVNPIFLISNHCTRFVERVCSYSETEIDGTTMIMYNAESTKVSMNVSVRRKAEHNEHRIFRTRTIYLFK